MVPVRQWCRYQMTPKNIDSLTYNHCVILFFQAFFHTELLANSLQAYQVQHTKKSITSWSHKSDKLNIKIKFGPWPHFFISFFFCNLNFWNIYHQRDIHSRHNNNKKTKKQDKTPLDITSAWGVTDGTTFFCLCIVLFFLLLFVFFSSFFWFTLNHNLIFMTCSSRPTYVHSFTHTYTHMHLNAHVSAPSTLQEYA